MSEGSPSFPFLSFKHHYIKARFLSKAENALSNSMQPQKTKLFT